MAGGKFYPGRGVPGESETSPSDTVVRDYFQYRVPISAVSRAETPNA